MAGAAERHIKVYTKTGDGGETGLAGGERVLKHTARIEAIGDVDELNSAIGKCRVVVSQKEVAELLTRIQCWLFEMGAELATPEESRFVNETIEDSHVETLERSIDKQTESLPALRRFILPGGSAAAAELHMARAICRRAERSVLRLSSEAGVRPVLVRLLNRLSDWLFVAARTANKAEGVQDVNWVSERGS